MRARPRRGAGGAPAGTAHPTALLLLLLLLLLLPSLALQEARPAVGKLLRLLLLLRVRVSYTHRHVLCSLKYAAAAPTAAFAAGGGGGRPAATAEREDDRRLRPAPVRTPADSPEHLSNRSL
jgi:hypothetical protein